MQGSWRRWMSSPFRYFKISLEIIRLAVMMHVRFPLRGQIWFDRRA